MPVDKWKDKVGLMVALVYAHILMGASATVWAYILDAYTVCLSMRLCIHIHPHMYAYLYIHLRMYAPGRGEGAGSEKVATRSPPK